MSYKRILVPVDGSPVSNLGLKEALKIARASRARVRLLHVVENYAAFMGTEAGANIGPVLDALRAAAKRTLARIERRARAAGIEPSTALADNLGGRVADAIIDEAKRWKADVIVMGTHGRRGVKRMLLGSDAELAIRYSPVPVLLVPSRR
jgi:nucleotide-binding universal stress UspA family protein